MTTPMNLADLTRHPERPDIEHGYRRTMRASETRYLQREAVAKAADDHAWWQLWRREARHELSRRGIPHGV